MDGALPIGQWSGDEAGCRPTDEGQGRDSRGHNFDTQHMFVYII